MKKEEKKKEVPFRAGDDVFVVGEGWLVYDNPSVKDGYHFLSRKDDKGTVVVRSEIISFTEYTVSDRVDQVRPVDKPKVGDLCIFWDDSVKASRINILVEITDKSARTYKDYSGLLWRNCIKFENKEQYKRMLKGK